MPVVLDASAVLALLFDEPGAHLVEEALAEDALISAVNWCEVRGKLAQKQRDAEEDLDPDQLSRLAGRLEAILDVVDFVAEDAELAASLLPLTQPFGLSLADRACLTLGGKQKVTVLTADRAWADIEIDVDVRPIR